MTQDPDNQLEIKLILASYLTGHGEWSRVIGRDDLVGVPPRLHMAHLAALVAERGKAGLSRDDAFAILRGASEVNDLASEAYVTYQPAPYDASDVLYFRSQEGVDAHIAGYDYLAPWREIIRSRLEVIPCPVGHAHMTSDKALPILIGPISAALAEIEARRAGAPNTGGTGRVAPQEEGGA
jgi:hypothetical protein